LWVTSQWGWAYTFLAKGLLHPGANQTHQFFALNFFGNLKTT